MTRTKALLFSLVETLFFPLVTSPNCTLFETDFFFHLYFFFKPKAKRGFKSSLQSENEFQT